MATIPNYWVWKTPIVAQKDVGRFKPYSGPSQTRGFGNGNPCHKWELGNDDSDHDEFAEIKTFWDDNYPGVEFDLYDPQLDESRVYEITSNFTEHYNHADSYAWSFTIEEVFPYTATAGEPE